MQHGNAAHPLNPTPPNLPDKRVKEILAMTREDLAQRKARAKQRETLRRTGVIA